MLEWIRAAFPTFAEHKRDLAAVATASSELLVRYVSVLNRLNLLDSPTNLRSHQHCRANKLQTSASYRNLE